MGTLEPDQIGNASGLFNLTRNLGGSIGIAGLTTLVARGAQSSQAAFVGHFSPYNPVYQQKLAAIQNGLAAREGAWRAAQQAPAGSLRHTRTTVVARHLHAQLSALRPSLPRHHAACLLLQEGAEGQDAGRFSLKSKAMRPPWTAAKDV